MCHRHWQIRKPMVDDKELLELVEMEVELLHEFPEMILLLLLFVFRLLEAISDIGEGAIMKLAEALDSHIPEPKEL